MEAFKELIRKIELQSVLVLLITLLVGYGLLKMDNSINTPAGILGSLSIVFGILYTFGSFFSNQIRESYKDVIAEYKSHISTLKTSNKSILDTYERALGGVSGGQKVGDYQTTSVNTEAGTQTD